MNLWPNAAFEFAEWISILGHRDEIPWAGLLLLFSSKDSHKLVRIGA
jgi:hypothetical protein